MPKIDFPNNPAIDEIYEYAGQKWRWDGKSWNSVSASNLSSVDITKYQLKDQLQGTVTGDLVPAITPTGINLGSATNLFEELHLNSIYVGTSILSVDASGDLLFDLNGLGAPVKMTGSGAGATNLNGLIDVDLTTSLPLGGDFLSWDGVNWVPQSETDPVFTASPAGGIVAGDIANWNTAHGWGDHSLVGYLTAEADPVFTASPAGGIVAGDIANWNTAHGWGDHSVAGYLTAEADPVFTASPAGGILATNITDWNTAHGWGDHSVAGYLTAEADPVFTASPAGGILATNITDWNTAHGWGDHSAAGYLTGTDAKTAVSPTNKLITETDISALGGGDMNKATYDTNNDGVVDNAAKVNNLTVETAVPAGAVFTDTVYVKPTSEPISYIDGLQDALDGKVDDSQVLTDVPAGAVFTDTVYTKPTSEPISYIDGLQDALDGKVDDSQVLTDVPANAVFTDTVYTKPTSEPISYIDGLQDALDGKVDDSQVLTDVPANAVFTDTVYTDIDVDAHLNLDSAGDGQVLSYTGGDYQWIDAGGGSASNGYVTLESADGNLKISGFGEESATLTLGATGNYEFSGGYLEIHSLPANFIPKRLEFNFTNLATNFYIIYSNGFITDINKPLEYFPKDVKYYLAQDDSFVDLSTIKNAELYDFHSPDEVYERYTLDSATTNTIMNPSNPSSWLAFTDHDVNGNITSLKIRGGVSQTVATQKRRIILEF